MEASELINIYHDLELQISLLEEIISISPYDSNDLERLSNLRKKKNDIELAVQVIIYYSLKKGVYA